MRPCGGAVSGPPHAARVGRGRRPRRGDQPPALATTMQLVSFIVVLLFFRIFGSRYLKGTYLI